MEERDGMLVISLKFIIKWADNSPFVDLVWRVIANSLGELISIWWENPKVVDKLNALRRVSGVLYIALLRLTDNVLMVCRACLCPWSRNLVLNTRIRTQWTPLF